MEISILLPTYNRCAILKNTLSQFFKQIEKLKNHFISVVVVVDGSNDGTLEMIEKYFPLVHVIKGDGSWFYTRSMNQGFAYIQQEIKPDYILAINDDVILSENYLEKMIEATSQVEPNSVIGCIAVTQEAEERILFSGVKRFIKWRQKYVRYHKNFQPKPKDLSGVHPSVILPGRGMLIPINVLEKLKGFDKYYVQYHSDSDFCLRAIKYGFKVYVSWEAKLLSFIEETASVTSYIKVPFKKFLSSYKNQYSRLYIPQKARFYWTHGIKLLWPITMVTFFLSTFKSFLFNKKLI